METFILFTIVLGFYLLFVKGFLWKSIVFFSSWVGIALFLQAKFQSSSQTFMNVMGVSFSWAWVISTVIVSLAMMTTKVEVSQ